MILGLQRNVSHLAVYGEIGIYPLIVGQKIDQDIRRAFFHFIQTENARIHMSILCKNMHFKNGLIVT